MKGLVLKSTGSWYDVLLDKSEEILPCRIVGKWRIEDIKITNPIAVGDFVELEREGENGMIQKILPRKNYVIRQSPRKKHQLHILASNIDQALLVITINKPKLKKGFIDRFLCMTEPYNIPVIIAVNKMDLFKQKEWEVVRDLESVYTNIGYELQCVSAKNLEGIKELKDKLIGKTTLVAGQSGVGKSSILNAIDQQLDLRTKSLSEYTGKGKHTTTFAEMLPLKEGGMIVDSPGIKTLSFNHLEVMDVAHNFREIFEYSEACKYNNCTHRDEPFCAVKNAVLDEKISEIRYLSYLQIISEIEDQNYWERNKEY